MSTSTPTPYGEPTGDAALPSLGDGIGAVQKEFSERGALGCLLVRAESLAEVERLFGHEAYMRCLRALGAVVRQVCQEAFGGTAWVLRGEVGRSEVVLFIARDSDDAGFLSQDLPALARLVVQRLARNGQRIVYPYLRAQPRLSVGKGYVLRNPRLGPVTQLREVIEEAREDADLNRRMERREKRRDLLDVIVAGRVRSVYEPIVDAKTLTVFGYEALVRGPANTELASPAALFPRAEEEDLSFSLDCLCRQKAIEGAHGFPEGAKLFMNIRPSAIHDPSFQPQELKRTLAGCELQPSDVVFEISEQESFENYDILREARDEYGKLGFQFALDDLGAGYASLEAALKLAPEFLKIDRAFVSGIDEDEGRQNMLRAFQDMAERMNASIIGEGLDKIEELQMLARLGIQFGQGWLFGKATPLRADTVEPS